MRLGSNYKYEDRLSNLPEDVLSHILSLMPTRFAVQTCILSKRWKDSWMMVTNIDFDFDDTYRLKSHLKFVDQVLEHCKTSQVNLFRLHHGQYHGVQRSSVSKWVDKAVRLNVCELDINVFWLDLPLSLFTCKTLTKLSIAASDYPSNVFSAPPLVMLPALKTLDIRSRSTQLSVNTFRLIHGCPMLESLSLAIDDNKDYNFNIPTLKKLELTTHSVTSVINKIVLNLPNLAYLYLDGMLSLHFVMENLSSLVEATVFFYALRDYNLKSELLKGLSGVKSLSWFTPTSHVNNFNKVPGNLSLPKFLNLKHLNLKGYWPFRWPLVFQLLESCYELKHLCIEEVTDSSLVGPESCSFEPESVPTGILSNLITIKITRCKWWNCDTQFVEYMLGNVDVLETLTITCKSLDMKDELELCGRLLKIPRASRFCEIHFVGKFV